MASAAGSLAEPWGGEGRTTVAPRRPLQLFWQRFREDRVALAALGFIVLEIVLALAAPRVVELLGHPPNAQYPRAPAGARS